MEYENLKPFIESGKKVVVKTVDDNLFSGIITNTESEFDTESGKEEIKLFTGKVFYGILLDEIIEF